MESKNELYLLFDWLSDDYGEAVLLYTKLRQGLILIFRSMNNAEDLADETIDRALKNIRNGKVDFSGNPFHYTSKIARYVKLEEFRKNKTLSLDENPNKMDARSQEEYDSREDQNLKENLYQIIEKCLKELPAEDKKLFLQYTFAKTKEEREILAAKKNISLTTLRVKMHRIRESLRICADGKLEK